MVFIIRENCDSAEFAAVCVGVLGLDDEIGRCEGAYVEVGFLCFNWKDAEGGLIHGVWKFEGEEEAEYLRN